MENQSGYGVHMQPNYYSSVPNPMLDRLGKASPIETIIQNNIPREVIIIDGAHEVFTENPNSVERILIDFSRVKPPQKFYTMTTIKQSLGVYKTSFTLSPRRK
jgi:hypothetical protein